MNLELPLLLLGAGGYSGVDACKTFAAIVATAIGQRSSLLMKSLSMTSTKSKNTQ